MEDWTIRPRAYTRLCPSISLPAFFFFSAFILVFILPPCSSDAQVHYQWRTFAKREGLIGNSIRDIVEDGSERLWFATSAGISVFDGLWTSFTTKDGLPADAVSVILQTSDGNLWFGTENGIAIYKLSDVSPRWEWLEIPESLNLGQDVIALTEALPGVVWIGTTQGAARYDAGRWDKLPLPDSLEGVGISAILVDSEENLWLGFQRVGKLMRFHSDAGAGQGAWEILDSGDGFPGGTVHTITQDASGVLWIGTDEGLARYLEPQWELVTRTSIRDAFLDAEGLLWFATAAGLQRYRSGEWRQFGLQEGLVSEDISAIWVDSHRRLWAGTTDRGVSFSDRAWQTWHQDGGLPGERVTSILQDVNGRIWVGTQQGLAYLEGERWEFVPLPSGREIRALTLGSSRRLWIATDQGIAVFDGLGWLYHTQEDGLGNNSVHSIMMDSAGQIWAGYGILHPGLDVVDLQGGFSWYDGLKWQRIPTDSTVTALLEDRDGRFWIGTAQRGLKKISVGPVEDITTRDGLTSNRITSISQAEDGDIWVGTLAGISVYDELGWRHITTDNGLIDNRVQTLRAMSNGEMWIGTLDGVSIFDGTGWSSLTIQDGLPGNHIEIIYETIEGDIWLGSNGDGISLHQPERQTPRVQIISGPRGIVGFRAVIFVFQGGDASTPRDELLYSYRLGIQDWSPFRSQTFASFSNLADGEYLFFVRVKDKARNISRPVQVRFTVDAAEPVAVIREPDEGQVIGGIFKIVGTATDTDFLEYQIEAGPQVPRTFDTPVEDDELASWDTTSLIDGKYSIRLSVWDSVEGPHDISHTRSDTVDVQVDNTPPTVEILSPQPGSQHSGPIDIQAVMVDLHLSEFTLKASQTSPGGTMITHIIQAKPTTGQSAKLPVTWDSSSMDGPVQIALEAVDAAGNRSQDQVEILLDNAAVQPEVRIDQPVDGDVVAGIVAIRGTAADPDLQWFELTYRAIGQESWIPIRRGSTSVNSAPLASWDTRDGITDGEYQLQLHAVDTNGYESRPILVSVSVDNTSPDLEITAPAKDSVIATSGRLEIRGRVYDRHLEEYLLEYASAANPEVWVEVGRGSQISGDILATWNTLGLDGDVILRLTAKDRATPSNTAVLLHTITLDSTPAEIEIIAPSPDQIVTGKISIQGTVDDEYFHRYQVSVGPANGQPTPLYIDHPEQPRLKETLAEWDTAGLEGRFEIKVEVWDQAGRYAQRTQSLIVDNQPPEATWLQPSANTQVRGSIPLMGSATDANLQYYVVEYRDLDEDAEISEDHVWRSITETPVTQNVQEGLLATWHTQDRPGNYVLRLHVTDVVGHESSQEQFVRIPEPVDPNRGGTVADNKGETTLIIPPRALSRPFTVTVNPVSTPSGGPQTAIVRSQNSSPATQHLSPVYELQPEIRFPTAKPAILEMRSPDTGHSWGIFRWEVEESSWRLIGGTSSGGRIRTPITQLGIFQVREVDTLPAPAGDLKDLRCQPRQLAPRRGERTAISFYLGSEQPVDAFVFNSAGRLLRTIIQSKTLSPGGNVVFWDGRDEQDRPVASGPYLVVVQVGNKRLQQGVIVWNQ